MKKAARGFFANRPQIGCPNPAATRRFWIAVEGSLLPFENSAIKNYLLWLDNPNNPSLRFRRLQATAITSPFASEIIVEALGQIPDRTIASGVWIGTHAEYDGVLTRTR